MELENFNNEKKMSSREIAELTGKEHRAVLRDCDKLNEDYKELSLHKIVQSEYKADNGQYYREYQLTKMHTFDLLTGYNSKLRIKVNRRWEELERQSNNIQIPTTLRDALKLAYEQQVEIEERQKLIEEQRPKVLFAESVASSNDSILVRDLAKILKQNGISTGQNKLFKHLRDTGFLCRDNTPTQRAMQMELFEIKEAVINTPKGIKTNLTTKVTGKGQNYFINKHIKNRDL